MDFSGAFSWMNIRFLLEGLKVTVEVSLFSIVLAFDWRFDRGHPFLEYSLFFKNLRICDRYHTKSTVIADHLFHVFCFYRRSGFK